MKTFSIALFFAMVSMSALGQDIVSLALSVVNLNNKPAAGLAVNAIETTTLKQVNGKTNAEGRCMLQLANGKEWAISVGEIKKCMHVVGIPGRQVNTTRFFVYDPKDHKRKLQQDHLRTNEKFRIVQQHISENSHFKSEECYLAIKVQQPDGRIVPGVVISVVSVKDSVIYRSKTNEKGMAFFVLPNKTNYEIDLNELKNFSYIDFGDEYRMHSLVLMYIPTIVKEKFINDTIHQQLGPQAQPSSERVLLKLSVTGGRKNGVHEHVYLRELASGKVYTTLTDDAGLAIFLVPSKKIYMIDFLHQKDVDAVNLLYASEVTTGQMKVHYAPDPRLEYPETFIPTPDRLLIRNFNSFLTKQFTKPKDKPFNLVLKSIRKINGQSREALFMLTLASAENYGNVRLPLNAALVLDKSGSMYSNYRSESLKRTLVEIGRILSERDNVSIVLFDDQASEVQLTSKNHQENFSMIADHYMPGGGTNIYGGLEKASESIQKNFDRNKSNRIILLTDGYGDNPPKEITDFVEAKFSEGMEFSAIGLGNDYNQAMLELIALKGHGTFSYVDESPMLAETFLKELQGSFAYCAKDLKVEVLHDKKMTFSALYGYPVTDQTDGQVTFEIGKVPHAIDHVAFLKFNLQNPSREIENAPLVVRVSYLDLVTNEIISYEEKVKLEWTDETDTGLLVDPHEQELYAIAILNQSIKLMAEAYERKDANAAKAALKSGKDQIGEIFPGAKPRDVKSLFDEADRYLQLLMQIDRNSR